MTEYTKESIVEQEKARIDELIDAHWEYVNKLLRAGQTCTQMYTFEQMMQIREFDYKSVAKHFYGHGWEDAEASGDVAQGVKDIIRRYETEKLNKTIGEQEIDDVVEAYYRIAEGKGSDAEGLMRGILVSKGRYTDDVSKEAESRRQACIRRLRNGQG